jgi:hypothetical protein
MKVEGDEADLPLAASAVIASPMFPVRSDPLNLALLTLALALAGCGPSEQVANKAEPTQQGSASLEGLWGDGGRDRLCLKGERAGLIVYAGEGNTNCTVRGGVERTAGAARIRPDGDASCVIEARQDGNALILGQVSPSCAYYCGPKASYSGKRLEPRSAGDAAVDLAGDPLC